MLGENRDDLQKILNGLLINSGYNWRLLFYKDVSTKTIRNFNFYQVHLDDIGTTINDIIRVSLHTQMKDMSTESYGHDNDKNTIDRVDISNGDIETVNEVHRCFCSIPSPIPPIVTCDDSNYTGCCFIGTPKEDDDECIFLCKKGNPIRKYKKANTFFRQDNYIREIKSPIVQLTLNLDWVFAGDYCFLISQASHSFFKLQSHQVSKAKSIIGVIQDKKQNNKIVNWDIFKEYSFKKSVAKFYSTFCQARLDKYNLLNDKERKLFLERHSLHYNSDYYFEPKTINDVTIFVKYLCEATARDYEDNAILTSKGQLSQLDKKE